MEACEDTFLSYQAVGGFDVTFSLFDATTLPTTATMYER